MDEGLFGGLQDAAREVIKPLKGIEKFADAKLAIIGGLAVMKYAPAYGTTNIRYPCITYSLKHINRNQGPRIHHHHRHRPN